MSEPFIAEIRMWPLTYAPRGWAYCDGQLLEIMQHTSLYSLIGSTFGGDGRTTFGLPNPQGRAPMHAGRGPGLTTRGYGEMGGADSVPLAEPHMPDHKHTAKGYMALGQNSAPGSADYFAADDSKDLKTYGPDDRQYTQMANAALQTAGESHPHENRQPFLVIPFCIALEGIYPART